MGGVLKPLPPSEAERELAGKINTLKAITKNEFTEGLSKTQIAQATSYYQKYEKTLTQLLELGKQMRTEQAEISKGAQKTIADTPYSAEVNYSIGSGVAVGALSSVGKALLDYNAVGLAGQALYKKIYGKELSHASWSEVGEMFTGPKELAEKTMKAYAGVTEASASYQKAFGETYSAYQGMVKAILSGDEAKAEGCTATLTSAVQSLQQARESLVEKINIADEMGANFRGLEIQADEFAVSAATTIATTLLGGVAVKSLAKGAGAIASFAGKTITKDVVEGASGTASAVGRVGRVVATAERVAVNAERTASVAGNLAEKGYEVHHINEKVEEAKENDRSVHEDTSLPESCWGEQMPGMSPSSR